MVAEVPAIFLMFVPLAGIIVLGVALYFGLRAANRRPLRSVALRFGGTLHLGGMDNLDQVAFIHRGALVVVQNPCDVGGPQIRISTPMPVPRLELFTEGPLEKLRKLMGMQDIVVGNTVFDEAFVVRGDDEAAVRKFLTPGVQSAALQLLAFQPPLSASGHFPSLHVQWGSELLSVTISGPTSNLEPFVAACLALFDAATARPLEGIQFTESREARARSHSSRCMVCGEALVIDVVRCKRCQTPHHRECWTYCGGCSTYGCRENVFVEHPSAGKSGASV